MHWYIGNQEALHVVPGMLGHILSCQRGPGQAWIILQDSLHVQQWQSCSELDSMEAIFFSQKFLIQVWLMYDIVLQ